MEKLRPPVAICTVCRKPGYNTAYIGQPCGQVYTRNRKQKRCRGVMQSAWGAKDWSECPTCNATGWEEPMSKRCTQCDGAGWIFARVTP
jgi:hypothetical protein